MTTNRELQKSILDEIFDEFFSLLQEHGFDADVIEKIEQLAQSGDLKKAVQVVKVIKATLEDRA